MISESLQKIVEVRLERVWPQRTLEQICHSLYTAVIKSHYATSKLLIEVNDVEVQICIQISKEKSQTKATQQVYNQWLVWLALQNFRF